MRKKRGHRKGYTTGACAAAAARAAAIGLVCGQIPKIVTCLLPNKTEVDFKIESSFYEKKHTRAVVIKDAGDDPDVTDKAHLTVDLYLHDQNVGEIVLKNGVGVGTVTQAGLGLEVNGPAINPIPQKNIRDNIREVLKDLLNTYGIKLVVSVPNGEQIAKRTLNSRLGIMGGISILGTSGIVHPWSTAAFRSSVMQAINVAVNQGHKSVVLTTGGRTEKFVISQLPDIAPICFIQMGDFIKVALDSCVKYKIKRVIIGAMVGKLTKMAQGENITHARKNPVNMQVVADIAKKSGADQQTVEDILNANTARYASEQMQEIGLLDEFYRQLAYQVMDTLLTKYDSQFSLKILICDFEGNKRFELDSEQLRK